MADPVHQGGTSQPRPWLTEGQQQMLQGVFAGLANKEIAARLGVTEGAVKASLQQLFQRTQVRTRSLLVRIALESSLGTLRGEITLTCGVATDPMTTISCPL
jgi:DNA-binding NarL/FixJ family response regulator